MGGKIFVRSSSLWLFFVFVTLEILTNVIYLESTINNNFVNFANTNRIRMDLAREQSFYSTLLKFQCHFLFFFFFKYHAIFKSYFSIILL